MMIRQMDVNGKYRVSTVRTEPGIDETPWPFETMVFPQGSPTGLYHEPFGSLREAIAGHERIVEATLRETLPFGHGVDGPYGLPSLTADEWEKHKAGTRNTRQGHLAERRQRPRPQLAEKVGGE